MRLGCQELGGPHKAGTLSAAVLSLAHGPPFNVRLGDFQKRFVTNTPNLDFQKLEKRSWKKAHANFVTADPGFKVN